MISQIKVILSPALFPLYSNDFKDSNIVVIDILRATTTMVHALANGALGIKPLATPDEAIKYQNQGFVCAAERDGVPYPGFELGNSPMSFSQEIVTDKYIALTTTNGTRCIEMAKPFGNVYIGSFLNISALANHLLADNKPVLLFCAGWKDKVNLEDTLFAGALIEKIMDKSSYIDCDAMQIALDVFYQSSGDLNGYLQKASHVQRFKNLHIDDLSFCLQTDIYSHVPMLKDGFIYA